jgi:hypothetical protein
MPPDGTGPWQASMSSQALPLEGPIPEPTLIEPRPSSTPVRGAEPGARTTSKASPTRESATADVGKTGSAKAKKRSAAERIQLHVPTMRDRLRSLIHDAPSWAISMVFHLAFFLILSLLTLRPQSIQDLANLVATTVTREEVTDLVSDQVLVEPIKASDDASSDNLASHVDISADTDAALADLDAAALSIPLDDLGPNTSPSSDLMQQLGILGGEGLEGRGARQKPSAVFARGGSAASERAVAAALQWIVSHQLPDGGWSFDIRLACNGACPNHGTLADARNGATALALLPLLGAGQTHREGMYRKNVQAGLNFLVRNMKLSNAGGSLHEPGGAMYSHGLATIALSEAYAMTRDGDLYQPTRQAVQFIVQAQDPQGGGWRYEPGQPGDTSAVGWQVMALKSAYMGQLEIPASTIRGVELFLNSVQSEGGAKYGYLTPIENGGSRPATTAIGLLCRMYTGWERDRAPIVAGVRHLDGVGPSMLTEADMYYNYYATQVMHHYGGEPWKRWNTRMREFLVNTQEKEGHATGSWYFADPHGSGPGGRLYSTALACMTLEIYYRYMPLYAKQALGIEFPVE